MAETASGYLGDLDFVRDHRLTGLDYLGLGYGKWLTDIRIFLAHFKADHQKTVHTSTIDEHRYLGRGHRSIRRVSMVGRPTPRKYGRIGGNLQLFLELDVIARMYKIDISYHRSSNRSTW